MAAGDAALAQHHAALRALCARWKAPVVGLREDQQVGHRAGLQRQRQRGGASAAGAQPVGTAQRFAPLVERCIQLRRQHARGQGFQRVKAAHGAERVLHVVAGHQHRDAACTGFLHQRQATLARCAAGGGVLQQQVGDGQRDQGDGALCHRVERGEGGGFVLCSQGAGVAADHMAFKAQFLDQCGRGRQALGAGVQFFVHMQVHVQAAVLCGFEQVAQRLRVPVGGMHKAAQQGAGAARSHGGGQPQGGAAVCVQVQGDQAHALQRDAVGPVVCQCAQHVPGQWPRVGLPPVAVGAQVHGACVVGPLQRAAGAGVDVCFGPALAIHHHGLDGAQQAGLDHPHAGQGEGLVQVGVRIHQAGQHQRACYVPHRAVGRWLGAMGQHLHDAALGQLQVGQCGLVALLRPRCGQQPARQPGAQDVVGSAGCVHTVALRNWSYAKRAMAWPTRALKAASRGGVATFMW